MIVEFALAAGLALSSGLATPVPVDFREPVTQVITYPPVGILSQLSGLPLPDGTRTAFEEEFLPEALYFGAFAITKDFAYGYVTGANSIEAARDIAVAECQRHGPQCLIYAEILPAGHVGIEGGQVSLSYEAAEFYSDPDPAWGQVRAMAVSEDGAYSVVWNYPTLADARSAALADCTANVITDLPDLRPMPCVVIPFK